MILGARRLRSTSSLRGKKHPNFLLHEWGTQERRSGIRGPSIWYSRFHSTLFPRSWTGFLFELGLFEAQRFGFAESASWVENAPFGTLYPDLPITHNYIYRRISYSGKQNAVWKTLEDEWRVRLPSRLVEEANVKLKLKLKQEVELEMQVEWARIPESTKARPIYVKDGNIPERSVQLIR